MSTPEPATPEPATRCPLCRRATLAAEAPFCSRGCRDRDLLNWLGDGYALPGPAADNALDNANPDN